MKLLFKSIYLFIFGAYVEWCKKRFDIAIDKTIKKGGDISCVSLTRMSNRCSELYSRFAEYEKDIKLQMKRKCL